MATQVDYTNTWKYPAEKDGWFRAHHALRQDMIDIKRMISAFLNQLEAGNPLTPDQAKAGKAFWDVFYHFLHHHHDNEEKIAFPFISKRAEIPSRMSEDHVYLVDSVDKCADLITKALDTPETSTTLKLLTELRSMFTKFEADMLTHLKEEEVEMMPVMRRVTSPAEYQKHIVGPIVRGMGVMDNGNFLDRMNGMEDRKSFYKQEGIPFFICWLLNWHHRKYVRMVKEPFTRAVAEAEAFRPPAAAA